MGKMVALAPRRGYFYATRDKILFDGKALPGVPPTGADMSSSKINLTVDGVRPISAEFNGEKITGRTWPVVENRLVVLELT